MALPGEVQDGTAWHDKARHEPVLWNKVYHATLSLSGFSGFLKTDISTGAMPWRGRRKTKKGGRHIMANVEKFTMSQIGHVCAHMAREHEHYSNQNIEELLSFANYNLAPERELSQVEYIRSKLDEIPHAKRKDLCVMGSWCVTAPKTLPKAHHERFFDLSYKFLIDRYGTRSGLAEDVCISSYVHMDESTPHMHFAFLPVVQSKDGSQRFCGKELINRHDLQTFHKDYKEYLQSHGMYADVNEGQTLVNSNGKALTVAELKKTHEITHENERRLIF